MLSAVLLEATWPMLHGIRVEGLQGLAAQVQKASSAFYSKHGSQDSIIRTVEHHASCSDAK
jgi:hypothetical protein